MILKLLDRGVNFPPSGADCTDCVSTRKQRSNFSGFAFNVPPGGIDGVGIRSTTSIKKSILITVVSILCGFIGARNEMAEFQRYFCDRRLMQRTLPVELSVELSTNLRENFRVNREGPY